MLIQDNKNVCCKRYRSGVVLLVTLVILVVLSTVGYILNSKVMAHHHRQRYIIDYQAAVYGRDSGLKYALATLWQISPELVSRPNEPDFSDIFSLTEEEYQEFLEQWATKQITYNDHGPNDINQYDIKQFGDFNDINFPIDINGLLSGGEVNEPNELIIRGPYGCAWPLVAESMEIEVGSATVTIEIEDENAKYPLGWAMLDDVEVKREAGAGFKGFCEWMDINNFEIDLLSEQLGELSEIKKFKMKFKPVQKRTTRRVRTRQGSRRGRRTPQMLTTSQVVSPVSVHLTDFAHLFHSSKIDTDILARATVVSDERQESALKYTGMWASRKVNINTAPRHVLEAAFVFGGDEVDIAEAIIDKRRIEPIRDIEELRKEFLRYSDSIEKCKEYITTESNFFTIKVTAVSGSAKASAIIAVTKERGEGEDGERSQGKLTTIAVISG